MTRNNNYRFILIFFLLIVSCDSKVLPAINTSYYKFDNSLAVDQNLLYIENELTYYKNNKFSGVGVQKIELLYGDGVMVQRLYYYKGKRLWGENRKEISGLLLSRWNDNIVENFHSNGNIKTRWQRKKSSVIKHGYYNVFDKKGNLVSIFKYDNNKLITRYN